MICVGGTSPILTKLNMRLWTRQEVTKPGEFSSPKDLSLHSDCFGFLSSTAVKANQVDTPKH